MRGWSFLIIWCIIFGASAWNTQEAIGIAKEYAQMNKQLIKQNDEFRNVISKIIAIDRLKGGGV